MKKLTKRQQEAAEIVTAYQLLYYTGLLNEKEKKSINKKINTRYKKELETKDEGVEVNRV